MKWLTLPIRIVLFVPSQIAATAGNVWTALVQILANKVRSLLTILGIIIAVTSIITVVSFVQGFGNYVTDFLRDLGTNLVIVSPDWVRNDHGDLLARGEMTIDDVQAVDAFATNIRRTTPVAWTSGTVEYGRQQLPSVSVRSVGADFQPIRNFYVDEGRFFGAVDVEASKQVCVLGRDVLRRLESDDSIVGDFVHIDGQRFQVIGLLETKGSVMGQNQDDLVLIPWTTGLRMYPENRNYMAFFAEAAGEDRVAEAEGEIVSVLRQRHALAPGQPRDFRIRKQDQLLEQFNRMKLVATTVLSGIVGISLLVGGIGIMNVMLVSVTERTREIGLRKSVGARRRDILLQFLTEAVVLSTVGGAIGIGFGYGIGYVAALHPQMVEVQVPLWSVVLALGFSAGVGVFFGIVPAFKAAIVHPIDALRHE